MDNTRANGEPPDGAEAVISGISATKGHLWHYAPESLTGFQNRPRRSDLGHTSLTTVVTTPPKPVLHRSLQGFKSLSPTLLHALLTSVGCRGCHEGSHCVPQLIRGGLVREHRVRADAMQLLDPPLADARNDRLQSGKGGESVEYSIHGIRPERAPPRVDIAEELWSTERTPFDVRSTPMTDASAPVPGRS